MQDLLLYTYLLNATILINHEIESAYWEEWKLFKLPGKITGFIIIHIPLIFITLVGGVELYKQTMFGYIISFIVAIGGLFSYFAHNYFIRKGEEGFDLIISKFLLIATLILSVVQGVMTIYLLTSS